MTAKYIAKENIRENKRYKIHTRFLMVICIMLFTMFLLIGIIFNIAVQRYIHSRRRSKYQAGH
jgi:hypothetical protein